jgi:hypothetical protein
MVRILIALVALALFAPAPNAAHAASNATKKSSASKSTPAKSATAPWNPVVPFIEDDFGRALALAKERKLPVFIEGWAPW